MQEESLKRSKCRKKGYENSKCGKTDLVDSKCRKKDLEEQQLFISDKPHTRKFRNSLAKKKKTITVFHTLQSENCSKYIVAEFTLYGFKTFDFKNWMLTIWTVLLGLCMFYIFAMLPLKIYIYFTGSLQNQT